MVLTTNYQRGALTDPILTRCQHIMADVRTDIRAQLHAFNSDDDHVHLLVHYPPAVAPSKLINSLTGVSTRQLRHEHGPHLRRHLSAAHLWPPTYFARSSGDAPLAMVKEHIQNQKHPGP